MVAKVPAGGTKGLRRGFLEVQSLVLLKGGQETTVQAGKDGLGRMNDRHEDRWGGIGDNEESFEGVTWRAACWSCMSQSLTYGAVSCEGSPVPLDTWHAGCHAQGGPHVKEYKL